ncbi:MAG: type II toxin-antitoxin system RatA family toxin [Burkholderiales bacterium]|nr:type II toxin-antitoxin system RatA family toxin [Burkholderiales bacterium]
MKTVHKSVLIWYSPHEMYVLVTDVNRYSEFLPWCDQARVVQEHDDGMTAEMGILFSGVRQTFSTRNVHTPDRCVDMKLLNGPFSRLDGQWHFTPLGDGSQRACKVELSLNYGFDSATLAKLVGPVFDRIAATMVEAFVKRAQQVYGD